MRLGEERAQAAAVRTSWRWAILLVVGAGLLAAFFASWWVLVPTAALMLWWCIPFIFAADLTEAADAESASLHESAQAGSER